MEIINKFIDAINNEILIDNDTLIQLIKYCKDKFFKLHQNNLTYDNISPDDILYKNKKYELIVDNYFYFKHYYYIYYNIFEIIKQYHKYIFCIIFLLPVPKYSNQAKGCPFKLLSHNAGCDDSLFCNDIRILRYFPKYTEMTFDNASDDIISIEIQLLDIIDLSKYNILQNSNFYDLSINR
jgi:hypothetical protein